MDLIGKTLGRYKIEAEIGHGGMAVVYRAVDGQTHNVVALKVLLMHLGSDVTQRRRFIREAAQVSGLQHPNIVDVYEVDTADGYWFIAMELVEGQALSAFLLNQSSRVSVDRATEIVAAVAAGLDYAHGQGLIHRDIKPGNILMGDDGRILLTDFGLAKLIDVEQTAYTRLGTSIGTPAYMSPEQAAGQTLDRRTDIYSLGVVAYLLFAGKTPRAADSTPALLHKVVYEPVHPPEQYNPKIPPGIVFALNRVLAKDPQARYQTAGSFAEALREGKSWVPSSSAQQAVIAAQTKMPDSQQQAVVATSAGARNNRRFVGWLLLLGAAGLALAFTLLFAFRGPLGLDSAQTNPASTQLIALVPYRAADGSYSINIPDGWTRSEEKDGPVQFVKFDAEDAPARIFLLQDAEGANNSGRIDSDQLRQYLMDDPVSFTDVTERSALEKEDLPAGEVVRRQFTVQWRGRPAVVTLSGFDDDQSFLLLGSAVEEQAYLANSAYARLHQTIAGSFRREEPGAGTAVALLTQTPPATATDAPTQTPEPSVAASETPIPTSTALVTGIDAVTATWTSTAQPIATSTTTPTPSATATATELPTSTPQPTAINTTTPTPSATATATKLPTSTPLPTRTATATATATSTHRPTSTPLPSATSTRTPRPIPTATRTATATATSTRKPTSTPVPTPSRTPTPPPTATSLPTATWTPVAAAPSIPQGRVSLLSLEADVALSGDHSQLFSWTPLSGLASNLLYEVVFWRPGGDGLSDGRSPVGGRTETSVQVDLAAADANPAMGDAVDTGREVCWGIRLWDTAAGRAAGMASDGCRLFTYTGTGGSSSGGDTGGDCPGCGAKP
ncbi:MAG: serine/threonine protein kinase [Caldilineaceae bacterium]|nr:serine/threonine protein kinase [Caldilineaceae bacterium]